MDRVPRWKELCEMAIAVHAHPTERRRAERWLRAHLVELTVGERVALARRASRSLIRAMASSPEPEVLRGLLENPRLVEADVVAIASRAGAPAEVLARLAADTRWGARREVAAALAANPRAPVAAALRAASRLPSSELRRLAHDDAVPTIVRVGASRLLDDAARGTARTPRIPAGRAPSRGPA
jgi:hypothetical protein